MLQKLGTVTVKLDTIDVEPGFKARLKEKHVRELADSIKESGLLEPIMVREKQGGKKRHIVIGRDRLAALMLLDVKQHEVQLVQGTDLEIETATLEENLVRRRGDDYDAMIARLVDIRAQQIQLEQEAREAEEIEAAAKNADKAAGKKKEPAKAGRKKSTKASATEAVAKAINKTPEAVRQAAKRDAAAKKEAAAPVKTAADKLETWGLDLTAEDQREFAAVVDVQEAMVEAMTEVKRAQKRLAAFEGLKSVPKAMAFSRTSPSFASTTEALKAAFPTAVCPYCALDRQRRLGCNGCGGSGYVGPVQLANIAPELKKRGRSKMVPDGRGGFELLKGADLTVDTTETQEEEVAF